jgi:hypothetical protein
MSGWVPEPGMSEGQHAAIDAADHGSGSATDGHVLTADGSGGAAWEAVGGGPGGADDGTTFYAVNEIPGSPDAMDDEFNDASFDTGLWSDLNIGSTSKTEALNALRLTSNETVQTIRGIYQTAPSSGSPWEFQTKVSMPSDAGGGSNQAIAGIFAAASTTGIVYNIGWYQDVVPGIRALQWATPTSNLAAWGTDVSGPSANHMYFKMAWTGSALEVYWSTDGVGWSVDIAAAIGGGWTPGIVGLGFTNRRGTHLDCVYDWFRRTV